MAEMQDLLAQPGGVSLASYEASRSGHKAQPEKRRQSALQAAILSHDLLGTIKLPGDSEGDADNPRLHLLPQRKRSALGIISGPTLENVDDDEDYDDKEAVSDEAVREEQSDHTGSPRSSIVPQRKGARAPQRRWKANSADDAQEPLFVWQKASGARCAGDLPLRLQTRPDDRSGPSAAGTARDSSPRSQHRHLKAPSSSDCASSPRPAEPAASPPRLAYGAWYLPRQQWWPLRQMHQEALDELSPSPPTPSPCPTTAESCHRGKSPSQRQHKPPLPAFGPAQPSPSARRIRRPSAASSTSSTSEAAETPAAAMPPSSPTSAPLAAPPELGIPDSFIGREYREFILNAGSPLPHYLQ